VERSYPVNVKAKHALLHRLARGLISRFFDKLRGSSIFDIRESVFSLNERASKRHAAVFVPNWSKRGNAAKARGNLYLLGWGAVTGQL